MLRERGDSVNGVKLAEVKAPLRFVKGLSGQEQVPNFADVRRKNSMVEPLKISMMKTGKTNFDEPPYGGRRFKVGTLTLQNTYFRAPKYLF